MSRPEMAAVVGIQTHTSCNMESAVRGQWPVVVISESDSRKRWVV